MSVPTNEKAGEGQSPPLNLREVLQGLVSYIRGMEKRLQQVESDCRQLHAENRALRDLLDRQTQAHPTASVNGAPETEAAREAEARFIPEGYRDDAFVTEVTMPDDVAVLAESFFYRCTSLRKVHLSAALQSVGNYAFYHCLRLEEIDLPRELEMIGDNAFCGCEKLKSIRIPGGVKSIGIAAFRVCGMLKSLALNANGCLREIGTHAFQDCRSLESVTLPKNLKALRTSVFYGCGALAGLDVPFEVECVEQSAFEGCASIREVHFHNPDTVLQPGATKGLQQARLLLAGMPLRWREITEPVPVSALAADPALQARSSVQTLLKE